MTSAIPEATSPFGERVRQRLTEEKMVWLTTMSADGTPQPNPVWFLWDGADNVLIYSRADAKRLGHIERNNRVALNFNANERGGDVVVFAGEAEVLDDYPLAPQNAEYIAKYGEDARRVSGDVEQFAKLYSTPIRVRITRTRGF